MSVRRTALSKSASNTARSWAFFWISFTRTSPSAHTAFARSSVSLWDADKKCLNDSLPKVLFGVAPVLWLKPKASKDISVYDHYDCPVYKTSERRGMLSTTGHSTNFVMMIRIPSDRDGDEWIKAGVAMLTQLDD